MIIENILVFFKKIFSGIDQYFVEFILIMYSFEIFEFSNFLESLLNFIDKI